VNCQSLMRVVKLIANRVAKNHEIFFKNFQFQKFFSTILFSGTNRKSHEQNYGSLKRFQK